MQVAPAIPEESPHTQATISTVHSISVASAAIQAILDRLVLVVDKRLARPVSGNIDVSSRKHYFQEQEDEIVNDSTEAEELASPDATAIVSLEAIDKRIALNASFASSSTPARCRMMTIKFMLTDGTSNTIIDSF